MQDKSVGMFVNFFSIVKGGAETYTANLSLALKKLGYKITIITAKRFFKKPKPIISEFPIIYNCSLYELRELARLLPGKFGGIFNLLQDKFYRYGLSKRYSGWDIIHVHGLDTASSAIENRKNNQPIILTLHGLPGQKNKELLSKLNFLTTYSNNVANYIREELNLECKLIPPGINLSAFYKMDKDVAKKKIEIQSKNIILFVGRLIPIKNLETLICSFKEIRGDFNDIKLVLVGNGVIRKKLEFLAKSLGIEKSVIFVGSVEQKNLTYYYNAADVLVLPSYYESYGFTCIEAMACECPVVVSDKVIDIHQQFSHVGVANSESAKDLAQKIISVLEYGQTKTNREILSRFEWANVAMNYARLYEKVLT